MMNHKPQTPRRQSTHPAPLTGWAKTRKVAIFAARGWFPYTHGCRVQRFRFCCTYVAPNVAVKIQQNQGLIAQVQRCNGNSRFTHMCARTHTRAHTPTRAHTRHTYRCTVAPLHLYYNLLEKLTRRLQALALAALKVVKPLFLLSNHPKTFVYRGFIG